MRSWASVVSGVAENEVPSPLINEDGFSADFLHPFNEDGFSADFTKTPQKRQPRNTKKRSPKRRKRKNKGQDYNLENYEYCFSDLKLLSSDCLSSRSRNYKGKYEQKVHDLSLLEAKFSRKDEILQETRRMLRFHGEKCYELEQMLKEFDNLRVALDLVNDDNGRVMKENEKLSDQLKKADEEIVYYMQQSEKLRCELDAAAQEKMAVSEELKKTKNMLKQKEIVEDVFDCLICMEPCVASGYHNTCSLPCGHFFGRSCIEQWISAKKISKCPVCQKKASLGGIRIHYT